MSEEIFNLYTPIIPKKGAAGLWIGKTHISQLVALTSCLDFRLEPEVSQFYCTSHVYIYFKNSLVSSLIFNNQSILYCIVLHEEYKGLFIDKIGIGTDVSKLYPYFAIEYDSVDELYYPLRHGTFDPLYEAVDTREFDKDHEYFGIGFDILEEEPEDNWWEDDVQQKKVKGIIRAITVQDWSLQSK